MRASNTSPAAAPRVVGALLHGARSATLRRRASASARRPSSPCCSRSPPPCWSRTRSSTTSSPTTRSSRSSTREPGRHGAAGVQPRRARRGLHQLPVDRAARRPHASSACSPEIVVARPRHRLCRAAPWRCAVACRCGSRGAARRDARLVGVGRAAGAAPGRRAGLRLLVLGRARDPAVHLPGDARRDAATSSSRAGARLRRRRLAFGLAALTRPEGVLFFALTALHRAGRATSSRSDAACPTRARAGCGRRVPAALVVPHLRVAPLLLRLVAAQHLLHQVLGRARAPGRRAATTCCASPCSSTLLAGAAARRRSAGSCARRPAAPLRLRRPTSRWWLRGVLPSTSRRWAATSWACTASCCRSCRCSRWPARWRCARCSAPRAARRLVVRPSSALCSRGYAAHAVPVDARRADRSAPTAASTRPAFCAGTPRTAPPSARWFGQHAQPDDYAAVGGAGAQVYYSRIPSLDCFGLSDAHIAHKVPAGLEPPRPPEVRAPRLPALASPTIITSNYYRIGDGACTGPRVEGAAHAATTT